MHKFAKKWKYKNKFGLTFWFESILEKIEFELRDIEKNKDNQRSTERIKNGKDIYKESTR